LRYRHQTSIIGPYDKTNYLNLKMDTFSSHKISLGWFLKMAIALQSTGSLPKQYTTVLCITDVKWTVLQKSSSGSKT